MLIRSLTGRLLLLTLLFVMLAEVLIFAPSIARFREAWLVERLERAQIASLALLATPDAMVTPELESELLATAEVLSIVLRREDMRELVLAPPAPVRLDATYDLREAGAWALTRDAFAALAAPPGRTIRVIGLPVRGGGVAIEALIAEDRLTRAMWDYALRILWLSLAISAFTAALIALSLQRFLVRPLTRVIDSMRAFAAAPEAEGGVIAPRSSIAEVAAAEAALAGMQTDLRAALRQRARLAALGEALAKVAHDLRNLLATAQLLADSLGDSADPRVARVGPKIIRSLDRAAALCRSTLDFGRVEEPAPELAEIDLHGLVEEVGESVFPDLAGPVAFVNAAPAGLRLRADPDQLHRVLVNLTRNAREAMEGAGRAGAVEVRAAREGEAVAIEVVDAGPGLPEQARAHLFQPFKGGARRGGAGLGLAIAAELARAHGGAVELVRTGPEGSAFRVRLPHHMPATETSA